MTANATGEATGDAAVAMAGDAVTSFDARAVEPSAAPGRPRRFDPKLAVASVAIAAGMTLVGFGVMRSVTGDDVTRLPEQIESISPVPDAVQTPSQASIRIDLSDGYTGRIVIDTVTYQPVNLADLVPDEPEPGAQIERPTGALFDPGTNTITFTPGDEAGFDEWTQGNHLVTVHFWKLDGEGSRLSYSWTFNVV